MFLQSHTLSTNIHIVIMLSFLGWLNAIIHYNSISLTWRPFSFDRNSAEEDFQPKTFSYEQCNKTPLPNFT